jgi:hypothetical protein
MDPFLYISDTLVQTTNETVTGKPIPLYLDNVRSLSFQQHWNSDATGTLAATTTVEVTNDPRALTDFATGTSTADPWTDITATLTVTSPTSGEGNGVISVPGDTYAGWAFIRLKCAWISGTGLWLVYFSAQD